jgi:hypothetical protein
MYFTWKVNIQNRAAANMATIVERTGLLSLILTDEEWDAYTANRTVAPDGSIVIAIRPAPSLHDQMALSKMETSSLAPLTTAKIPTSTWRT